MLARYMLPIVPLVIIVCVSTLWRRVRLWKYIVSIVLLGFVAALFVNPPHGFSLEAWGDLEGSGVWTFSQDGPMVDITYDWRIRAEKPLLRYLSFLLKPIFSANHRWAMARGEESLRAELARRAGAGQQRASHSS